jgi:hypothetical protein
LIADSEPARNPAQRSSEITESIDKRLILEISTFLGILLADRTSLSSLHFLDGHNPEGVVPHAPSITLTPLEVSGPHL